MALPCTQEFPRLKRFPDCTEPLMGTHCEEKQSFLQLPETLAELRSRLADVGLSFINQLLLQGQYPVAWGPWRLILILGGETALQGCGWGSGHLGGPCVPVGIFPG